MLQANRAAIEAKAGMSIEIARIGIRDPYKPRSAPGDLFTTDLYSIVRDPSIDVVLELIGGTEPAGELIDAAIRQGKHVITANKELLAKDGDRLIALATERGLDLHFEAAVGGGIPLIQVLKHQLAGNQVLKMMGILNGTTNFILTKMSREGSGFAEVLAEAQAHGYAEADPTNDVDGFDARYKLAILSSIAFGGSVQPADVYCQGISRVESRDIELAHFFGCEIKLLAIAEQVGSSVIARVHPTFVPNEHPLASVNGADNALWLRGDFVGDLMLRGRGAGADATASAVVGDLIDVARNIRLGGCANATVPSQPAELAPVEHAQSRFYLRVIVDDKPSVLGSLATVLGHHGVSLAAMEMQVLVDGELGEIVFMTHPCAQGDFLAAVGVISSLQIVRKVANWFHVESNNTFSAATAPQSTPETSTRRKAAINRSKS